MPITYTPIRYPGGKSKIYPLLEAIIAGNGLDGCTYAEAFCGGAGLAVKLLLKGRVSKIVLNDIDPAVFSMWDAIVNHPEELCAFIGDASLSMDEWSKQRNIYLGAHEASLELGKAAFYLNRTNRSGILGARPIGGMGQTGAYKIDARFNAKELQRKVGAIAEHAAHIELHNLDARAFIGGPLRDVCNSEAQVLANFDPPYIRNGPKLYTNFLQLEDHRQIAEAIGECSCKWIVTYDNDPLVDELYRGFQRYDLAIGYSAYEARKATEILVACPGLKVPEGYVTARAEAA